LTDTLTIRKLNILLDQHQWCRQRGFGGQTPPIEKCQKNFRR